jgi:alginate O-acetyltransferase complex protein AlgI
VLFTTYAFLFGFLPLALAGWWWIPGRNGRLAFLTGASWVFYAWWDWRFLPLLVATTSVDYVAALAIARSTERRRRRTLLAASLAVNLGILVYFKYATFFLSSLNGMAALVGLDAPLPVLRVLLPIGISFYTFNSMSYTIDVYRGRVQPTRHILEYTSFVALFPHLIAGPIVRFTDIADTLRRPALRLSSPAAAAGLFFLSCGLVKKLLIADRLDPFVDQLYASSHDLGLLAGWVAAVAYTLQLYFDFSGYSDMAVGLAWLLGFRFPQNFNSPLKAENIADFWRRWHMTLSAWLRDYLFIPLGGSRHGIRRTVVALGVTMFLGGLWHGAASTFVVWGVIQGTLLAGHALLRNAGLTPRSVAVNRVLTFSVVAAAFVVFRSPNLSVAGSILGAMVGLNGIGSTGTLELLPLGFLCYVAALLVFVNVAPNTWEVHANFRPRVSYGLALGTAAALAVMTIAAPHPFIYFQF